MRKSFLIFLLLNSFSAILAVFLCPTPEGYFPDPEDKHKFYECSANIPYSFTCPEATIFDSNTTQCQFDPDPNATTPTRTTTSTPSITTTKQTLATIPIATTQPPTDPPTTPTTPTTPPTTTTPTTPPTTSPTTIIITTPTKLPTTTPTIPPTTPTTTEAPTTPTIVITTPTIATTTVSWAAQKSELEKKIKEIANSVSQIVEETSDAADQNNAERKAAVKIRINEELKIVESTEMTLTELEKSHTSVLDKYFLENALESIASAKKHLNNMLVLANSFKF